MIWFIVGVAVGTIFAETIRRTYRVVTRRGGFLGKDTTGEQ